MSSHMRFASRVFFWAGVYGIITLVPQYFLESRVGMDYPPPITHPEYFYGFVGLALAWQLAFLAISRDPLRYRLLMLPAIVEKLSFGLATIVLYLLERIPTAVLVFGAIDLTLAALFLLAFRASGRPDA